MENKKSIHRISKMICLPVLAAGAFIAITATGCSDKEVKTLPDFVEQTMHLVWSDEFDKDGPVNPDSWEYKTGAGGWGNNEVQNYTKEEANSYCSDGTLKICAVRNGHKWTSARLVTQYHQTFKYGYIEFRAKIPTQNGTWPALWMMPERSKYGTWPRSGEIDVMEFATATWGDKAYGTIHCRNGYGGNTLSSVGVPVSKPDKKWHTYAVDWQEDHISWYYDGELLTTYKNPYLEKDNWMSWPFDQEFHIIMNLAMGGTLGGDIDKKLEKAVMEVDYVRVYQK